MLPVVNLKWFHSTHSSKPNHKKDLPKLELLKWPVTLEHLQYLSPFSQGNVIENAKWIASWKLKRFDILVVLISNVFPLLSSLFKQYHFEFLPFCSSSLVFRCIFSYCRWGWLRPPLFLQCLYLAHEALLLKALWILKVLSCLGCYRAGSWLPAQTWVSQNPASSFCNLSHLWSVSSHL